MSLVSILMLYSQELHSIKADVWQPDPQPLHSHLSQGWVWGRRPGWELPELYQRSRLVFSFMASCGHLLHSPHHRHGLHPRICPRLHTGHLSALPDRDSRGLRGGGQPGGPGGRPAQPRQPGDRHQSRSEYPQYPPLPRICPISAPAPGLDTGPTLCQ